MEAKHKKNFPVTQESLRFEEVYVCCALLL